MASEITAGDEAGICAAWDTDWYRDLQACPATNVKIDRLSFAPVRRFLEEDEGFEVLRKFRAVHSHRVRLINRILDRGQFDEDDSIRESVRTQPFVAFRPRQLAEDRQEP